MVVARAHFVEYRRLHFDAQRFGDRLRHVDVEGEPIAFDHEGDFVAIDEGAVFEDVTGLLALDRAELVAHEQTGARSWRVGFDNDDARESGVVWARDAHDIRLRPCRPP